MFKGFYFFLREGWKYDKRYVIWMVLQQIVNAMIPVAGVLLPKMVIDELMGAKRMEQLILCVGLFAGYACIAGALTQFFNWDSFNRRCVVAAKFDLWLHERLSQADYGQMESPSFLDMQTKAKKFLTCDYHGFGYLLDCAMGIVGQLFTLIGLIAVLSTLHA